MLEGIAMVRLAWTNNIAPNSRSGSVGQWRGRGKRFTGHAMPREYVQEERLARAKSTVYPAGNFSRHSLTEVKFVNRHAGDYRLAAGSPYENAGTDGKDLGADIAAVTAATAGVDDKESGC